jgi:5-methylcytosine-specific restriction endonuclease McrA
MDTLVLNADGLPLSLLPISAESWQSAIQRMWANQVQVLHVYDDWVVHSPSMEIKVPSVVVMNYYKKPRKFTRFSGRAVKLRDNYRCAYCENTFTENLLTLDHVKPKSHGGPRSWDNIVSACQPCNGRRGNNVGIRPKWSPFKPTYWQLIAKRKEYPLVIPHESWIPYLDWNENNIVVQNRKRKISL